MAGRERKTTVQSLPEDAARFPSSGWFNRLHIQEEANGGSTRCAHA